MRIYSMTATFGKLEHETLTLNPGMNVICAPNEWGKSTWCAFLIAMLYGMDTRAKTTKTVIADKEHYAPWSGSPMSGRLDLNWNGRDITIERSTKGRIPLGVFRAYETGSGVPVPELTAANCGQLLLGVEQSVFRRAGFIRQSDLPVTKDDALLHRLNALVTTGDESGDAARLEQSLRELKNKCRYNRSGLLPQAESEKEMLEAKLDELESIAAQSRSLTEQLRENAQFLEKLEIHAAHLTYQEAAAHASRLQQAEEALLQTEAMLQKRQTACSALPSPAETQELADRVLALMQEKSAVESRILPTPPDYPMAKRPFRGMEPAEAEVMVIQDSRRFRTVGANGLPFFLCSAAAMLCSIPIFYFLSKPIPALFALILGLLLLIPGFLRSRNGREVKAELIKKYGSSIPDHWTRDAASYAASVREYQRKQQEYRMARTEYDRKKNSLREKHAALCGDATPEQILIQCQQTLKAWELLAASEQEASRAKAQLDAISEITHTLPKPESEDTLDFSANRTSELMKETAARQQFLQERIAQYRGRADALGSETHLRHRLLMTNDRIRKLEETYSALTLALETLSEASAELRRRFAPRIGGRAQDLLAALTAGRYERLSFGEDFSLRSASGQEDTLHDALWRSDGTIDQLYLALRLAVAEELTPHAPLVLDDALVRFDDARMEAAMGILKDMSSQKQIILFTCQKRETTVI